MSLVVQVAVSAFLILGLTYVACAINDFSRWLMHTSAARRWVRYLATYFLLVLVVSAVLVASVLVWSDLLWKVGLTDNSFGNITILVVGSMLLALALVHMPWFPSIPFPSWGSWRQRHLRRKFLPGFRTQAIRLIQ